MAAPDAAVDPIALSTINDTSRRSSKTFLIKRQFSDTGAAEPLPVSSSSALVPNEGAAQPVSPHSTHGRSSRPLAPREHYSTGWMEFDTGSVLDGMANEEESSTMMASGRGVVHAIFTDQHRGLKQPNPGYDNGSNDIDKYEMRLQQQHWKHMKKHCGWRLARPSNQLSMGYFYRPPEGCFPCDAKTNPEERSEFAVLGTDYFTSEATAVAQWCKDNPEVARLHSVEHSKMWFGRCTSSKSSSTSASSSSSLDYAITHLLDEFDTTKTFPAPLDTASLSLSNSPDSSLSSITPFSSSSLEAIKCAFCNEDARSHKTRPFLPHPVAVHWEKNAKGKKRAAKKWHYVHKDCAEGSSQTLFDDCGWHNIDSEIRRGSRHVCSVCKKKGATLGCVVEGCRVNVHVSCARGACAGDVANSSLCWRGMSKDGAFWCRGEFSISNRKCKKNPPKNVAAWVDESCAQGVTASSSSSSSSPLFCFPPKFEKGWQTEGFEMAGRTVRATTTKSVDNSSSKEGDILNKNIDGFEDAACEVNEEISEDAEVIEGVHEGIVLAYLNGDARAEQLDDGKTTPLYKVLWLTGEIAGDLDEKEEDELHEILVEEGTTTAATAYAGAMAAVTATPKISEEHQGEAMFTRAEYNIGDDSNRDENGACDSNCNDDKGIKSVSRNIRDILEDCSEAIGLQCEAPLLPMVEKMERAIYGAERNGNLKDRADFLANELGIPTL